MTTPSAPFAALDEAERKVEVLADALRTIADPRPDPTDPSTAEYVLGDPGDAL